MDKIADYEQALTAYCLERMKELNDLDIYHAEQENSGPVIAFNLKNIHPHDVSSILDYYGVGIRAGHHCTQPLHRWLGQNSTNRVSFAFYNTKEEIDLFIEALQKVKEIMQVDNQEAAE